MSPGSRQEGRIERSEIPSIVLVRETLHTPMTPLIIVGFTECWRSYLKKDGETSFPNTFNAIVD